MVPDNGRWLVVGGGLVRHFRQAPSGQETPEAQTTHRDDPVFEAGEIWSHYLDNTVIWALGHFPGIEEKVRQALASVDPDLVL